MQTCPNSNDRKVLQRIPIRSRQVINRCQSLPTNDWITSTAGRCSGPDLVAFLALARFQQFPTVDCHRSLNWILRNIKGTLYFGLPFQGHSVELAAYVDSDYAGNTTDRNINLRSGIFSNVRRLSRNWLDQELYE